MTMQTTSRRPWRRNAIALAASAIVLALPGFDGAYAQSTVVGSVFGQVAAAANAQVVVENAATGVKRTATVGSDGRFQVGALPPGNYRVSLVKDGKATSTVDIEVLAGQGAEAVFAAGSGAQTIVVTGRIARLDVSSSVNASVFTARELASIPIATRDLNGIIALANNTVRADSRYAGGISIGGGAPSENAFYINGMPVTNALTQLGSIELPFGAIQQAQVQTGGFGAEFGRSVGGVVNVITKSGTNEWHGGASFEWEPNSLRSKPRSSYYEQTGGGSVTAATDGTIYFDRSKNERESKKFGAYIGGPLVQDKMFFFVAADRTDLDTKAVNQTPQAVTALGNTGWREANNENTRYLGKVDWYLTDNHHFEATLFGDNYKTTDDYFAYSYATGKGAYRYSQYSKNLASVTPSVGGDGQILRYTGTLTQDLTITALYGQTQSKHKQEYNIPVSTAPLINGTTASTSTQVDPRITTTLNAANLLPAGSTGIGPGAKESTKSFRFDLEYRVGSHLLRAGADENRLKSTGAGDVYLGGNYQGQSYYSYVRAPATNLGGLGNSLRIYGAGNPNGQTVTLNQAGATPLNGFYYYVRARNYNSLTEAQSNQSAQYIEDRWQATKNVLLTLGLRNESFENKNGDGQTFLKMDSFISPRFNAAWDVNGDASMKVFGSAGRFSLQIPTHVAVRGASRSTLTDKYYAYTGIDPVTGAPTGLTALGGTYSANNEYGQAKDPLSVSAQKMKPTYQDEVTLGFEKALTPRITGGVTATYRQLKATIDDFCDYRVIDSYADRNGISEANYGGFGCATINAGQSNTLLINYNDHPNSSTYIIGGPYTTVPLSAADIGLPKPKRTYFALDFMLEHPLSDGWYGKVTYTWSKSKGNTEGQTKSDNAQTDVAVTSTWDFPEVMENGYGYLPNDRRHSIKAFGSYQFNDQWTVGSALLTESGRPKNCFGKYSGTGEDFTSSYGAIFFYCGGQAAPRGSRGRLPWNYALDFNTTYKPGFAKGLSFRADIFNVMNRQTAQVIDEAYETTTGAVAATGGRVISYSTPRKVRLTASYDF